MTKEPSSCHLVAIDVEKQYNDLKLRANMSKVRGEKDDSTRPLSESVNPQHVEW